jgi:hypothetical protein
MKTSENCNSNLKPLYLTLAATAAAGFFFVPNAT